LYDTGGIDGCVANFIAPVIVAPMPTATPLIAAMTRLLQR
jgi:hypothetical protein